jgi:hypothetical protein
VRVLLDENIPVDLARRLDPHQVDTVAGLGWQGTKNGELLRRATGSYDALVTMGSKPEASAAALKPVIRRDPASRTI